MDNTSSKNTNTNFAQNDAFPQDGKMSAEQAKDLTEELIGEAMRKIKEGCGKFNIIIAGRTGVGKSTLINAVFTDNLAETGQGRPVTSNTKELTKAGVPVSLFDTRGLELKDYQETFDELENEISRREKFDDPNEHIHLAWICVQEGGRRVEEAEIELHNMLAGKDIPIINVITKVQSDEGFSQEVAKLLPLSKETIRVRAKETAIDGLGELPTYNLEELLLASSKLAPEGQRNALAASQKVSVSFKEQRARIAIKVAANTTAVIASTPIPLSDWMLIAPIQVAMLGTISNIYGMKLNLDSLKALLVAVVGVSGASLIGKSIVTSALKLVPGAGAVTAGISAVVAKNLTLALGEAYIKVLNKLHSDGKTSTDVTRIGELLKAEMMKGKAAS